VRESNPTRMASAKQPDTPSSLAGRAECSRLRRADATGGRIHPSACFGLAKPPFFSFVPSLEVFAFSSRTRLPRQLALTYAPRAVVKNLRRFYEYGLSPTRSGVGQLSVQRRRSPGPDSKQSEGRGDGPQSESLGRFCPRIVLKSWEPLGGSLCCQ
jgi:hypothetical protein